MQPHLRKGTRLVSLRRIFRDHPALCLLLAAEFTGICYINLFRLNTFLGYDCSSNFLQTVEICRQKRLLLQNWQYQSTLALDYPLMLAVPFYALFRDIFVASGLANIVVTVLFLWVYFELMRLCGLSERARLIGAVLALTPYFSNPALENDLGYFSMMFVSMAAYSLRTVMILTLWVEYIRLRQDNRLSTFRWVLVIALCLWTGFASGAFSLAFCIAPLMAYWAFHGLFRREWLRHGLSEPVFLAVSVLSIFIGKFLCSRFAYSSVLDTSVPLHSLGDFSDSLNALIGGYLSLTGSLPKSADVAAFSVQGICYLFFLLVSLSVFAAAVASSVRLVRARALSEPLGVILFGLGVNLSILLLTRSFFGNSFEDRYLIVSFLAMIVLAADSLDELFACRQSSHAVRYLALVCMAVVNTVSYLTYIQGGLDLASYEAVISAVGEQDSGVVYSTENVFARNLRVLDLDHAYIGFDFSSLPDHWGDLTAYDDVSSCPGTVLLLTTNSLYQTLPDYYRKVFTTVADFDGSDYILCSAENNPFDWASVSPALGESSVDLMSCPYIYTMNGWRNQETLCIDSSGKKGFVTFGPRMPAVPGVYDITVQYAVDFWSEKSVSSPGYLDAAIEGRQIGAIHLDPDADSVTVRGVTISESDAGRPFEYRVYAEEGTLMHIRSFELTRTG